MQLSKELAKELLSIKAVQINPNDYFTWTSGIQSPIYCDNRLTMSYPAIRKKISQAFAEMVSQMEEKPEVIAGCATAGIPHAAWLAELLDIPMVYVRSKPKGHGKGNQIEGESVQGKKVLVIEDLISTGSSSLESVEALRHEGANVLQVLSIVTYGLRKAETNFLKADITYRSITSYDEIIEALVQDGMLTETEKTLLLEWRNSIDS